MIDVVELIKNKYILQGKVELYEKFVQAEKDGKTFKEALKEFLPKTKNEKNRTVYKNQ